VNSVAEHYERVLSPVYAWMAGGVDAALAAGAAEIEGASGRDARRVCAIFPQNLEG